MGKFGLREATHSWRQLPDVEIEWYAEGSCAGKD
jgi:hypothetical protein